MRLFWEISHAVRPVYGLRLMQVPADFFEMCLVPGGSEWNR